MYESDDEQSERLFQYHEGNNNKNDNIENDDSKTDLALRALGPSCQDVCLIFSSNDRTLGQITSLGLGVDFTEGGKLENSEKNPRSTGETNYDNSTHMSSKFF